jgi:hypothetical protein
MNKVIVVIIALLAVTVGLAVVYPGAYVHVHFLVEFFFFVARK